MKQITILLSILKYLPEWGVEYTGIECACWLPAAEYWLPAADCWLPAAVLF